MEGTASPFRRPSIDKWYLFSYLAYNFASLLTAANALSSKYE